MPTPQRLAPNAKTSLCLLAVFIGMVLLQKFARQTGSGREKPGPTRGDLVLTEEALPAEIAGWTRTKFIPAPPVDELPEGQYWWVHQWQYQKDGTTALVSFDQLGESNWHELTYCYTGLDWVIVSRDRIIDQENECPYVVALMRKDSGEHCVLVFSIFFQDGGWANPPGVDLNRLNWREFKGSGLFVEARDRLGLNPVPQYVDEDSGANRTLQCQVLVANDVEISQELRSAAIDLHLGSRAEFRRHWLSASRTNAGLVSLSGKAH